MQNLRALEMLYMSIARHCSRAEGFKSSFNLGGHFHFDEVDFLFPALKYSWGTKSVELENVKQANVVDGWRWVLVMEGG